MNFSRQNNRRVAYVATMLTFGVASFVAADLRASLLTSAGQYPICLGSAQSNNTDEGAFLTANASAMSKMMASMAIKPGSDVDHDFVEMMVPHHQGAIEMAQAELRYGSNDQLKRMAQEIIVTQRQEIVAMRLALSQPLPPNVQSTRFSSAQSPDLKQTTQLRERH
jgi:Domain of unknown function (DUF305)